MSYIRRIFQFTWQVKWPLQWGQRKQHAHFGKRLRLDDFWFMSHFLGTHANKMKLKSTFRKATYGSIWDGSPSFERGYDQTEVRMNAIKR